MRSRRAYMPITLVAAAVSLLVAIETAYPSGFEYSQQKRQIKVGILLVQSARTKTGAGNPPGRDNLENPDPHVFYILDRSPWKPPNWDLINPLAPSVVTDEVLARWDKRYSPGFADPYYGGPANRVVKRGDPVTKDSGAYWEVVLSEENLSALMQYDMLLITNHTITGFSPSDRDLLRRLVDAGGIVLVDDCAGLRITHANALGQIPTSDFIPPAPGAPLDPTGQFLGDSHPYFGMAYFAYGGGAGLNEPTIFDYTKAAKGFFTDLEFNDDPNGAGSARIADRYNPLLTNPYWLTIDDLNRLGDKQVTTYRIAAYNGQELFPVVGNTAYETGQWVNPVTSPFGQPYVAMGYFGEGLIIAASADVGCAINDYGVEGGKRTNVINGQNNSGYWCGNDFHGIDTRPELVSSVKFALNSINMSSKWRGGLGGPRLQSSTKTDIPNGLAASSSADLPGPMPTQFANLTDRTAGNCYMTSTSDVIFAVVPSDSGNQSVLVAMDALPGRDLDGDGNPDDGWQGTPAIPAIANLRYPQFDVIWATTLGGGAFAGAPVIGRAAYQPPQGPAVTRDVVFTFAGNELSAFEALPRNGNILLGDPVPFGGWNTDPIQVAGGVQITGMTYHNGRLYAEWDAGSGAQWIGIYDANTGTVIGSPWRVPGRAGPVMDPCGGPAVAIVQDTYNSAVDETLYVTTSQPDTNAPGQLLAIVTRTWDERMRPVGVAAEGTDSNSVTVPGCYRYWRIRPFARFDGTGATAPSDASATVFVNGVELSPNFWDFVYDDPAMPNPANVPESDGDWQGIRFLDNAGNGLKGLVPGGTTAGVPASAEVLVTYTHKQNRATSFPLDVANAGSVKWRYIYTHRRSPVDFATLGSGTFSAVRPAVTADGSVIEAATFVDANVAYQAAYVVKDYGYPTDLANVGPPGVDPAPPWTGDEVDQAGSFVFWQESLRPHNRYALESPVGTGLSAQVLSSLNPSAAVSGTTAVVRTNAVPINGDPEYQAQNPPTYAVLWNLDLSAPMSLTLSRNAGMPLPLDATLSDPTTWGPGDTNPYRPYGIELYDVMSGSRIAYRTANNTVTGKPTRWWVDPVTASVHFLNPNLAGRLIRLRISGPLLPVHEEVQQLPPAVIGQYPAMAVKLPAVPALPTQIYSGSATNPDDWVTPIGANWATGVFGFCSTSLGSTVNVAGSSYVPSRVNRDLAAATASIPEGAFASGGTPVIAGERVVIAGNLDRTFTAPNVAGTPRYSDGVLVLALDPRDESMETPPGAPTWGAPAYRYLDRGTPDPFSVFFADPSGPAPNPNYDLLGFGIGQSAASALRTPRGAPLVTPDGVGAFYLVESADPTPRFQWWSAQDTVVACQNRIIAVDSGRTMMRDIPSSGDWQNVGQVALPGGATRTSELGWFRGISRPRSIRDLAYVMKKGNYHICDSGNNQVVEISKDGTVVSAILNRDQPAFGGEPQAMRAFYDEPGWWPDFDLPSGSPRTLSAPHDAYRWEVTVPVMAGLNPEDWVYQFDWIADTGNNRLLGLMRELPPSTTDPRRGRYHLMWESDSYQPLLDATGKVVERGPALTYVTAWPLRTPASACELTDADPSVTIAPPGTIRFADGNFAGVVAAINGQGLSTVPGDAVNSVRNNPGRVDPYPRDLGPGATVALVGRLYNSAGALGGPLDRIDNQIQWAFSQLYVEGVAPDGSRALVPFRKLETVNYVDVQLVTGPAVPTGDPAVFYITIADDTGIYPVTYYPVTGPWAAAPANLFAGRAVVSLPPSNALGFGPINGYGPAWWFDGQEYATTMGSLGRNADPLPGAPGPDKDPQWAGGWLVPDNAYAYPVEYTGLVAGRAGLNPGDPGPPGDLLADTTFSFFRPIHVEREADGQYLVTNGHERKGEVLLLNPYVVARGGAGPTPAVRRYDLDYLRVFAWALPDPIRYRLGAGGNGQNPNTPEIGEIQGGTYNLGQPWAATRRTTF